jgi:hypothetical protein
MNLMLRLIVILSLLSIVGCSSPPLWSSTTMMRQLHLSLGKDNDFVKARLVSVAPDGTATIEHYPSGQRFTAAPGEYFVSDLYGTHGLRLLSSSVEKQEVYVESRWAQ